MTGAQSTLKNWPSTSRNLRGPSGLRADRHFALMNADSEHRDPIFHYHVSSPLSHHILSFYNSFVYAKYDRNKKCIFNKQRSLTTQVRLRSINNECRMNAGAGTFNWHIFF